MFEGSLSVDQYPDRRKETFIPMNLELLGKGISGFAFDDFMISEPVL